MGLLVGSGDRALRLHCRPNSWTSGYPLAMGQNAGLRRQIHINAGCPVGDCEGVGISNREMVAHEVYLIGKVSIQVH